MLEALLGGPAGWADLAVADLYAGSGALGLEALSRGAARAVLVDSSRQAARLAGANATALGLEAQVQVVCAPVERSASGRTLVRAGPFGLVFLDPPYELAAPDLDRILARLARSGPDLIKDGALVVVERSARSAAPTWPSHWEPVDRRSYGDTAVHLGRAGHPLPNNPLRSAVTGS
jgi:16S rRNA (guanine966-N2)-methyltransferase